MDWQPVTPAYVASVLERYPAQRVPILTLAQQEYGHAFVRMVLSQSSFTEEDTQECRAIVGVPDEQAGCADV